jgi:serine/threonine protein kinase
MHCDLKPANVVLKSTAANRRGYTCKLCDFGMSRLLDLERVSHVSTERFGVRMH